MLLIVTFLSILHSCGNPHVVDNFRCIVQHSSVSRRIILARKITFIRNVNLSGFNSLCEFEFNLKLNSVLSLIVLKQISDLNNYWLPTADIWKHDSLQLPNFLDVYFNKFIPIKLPILDRKVISSFTSRLSNIIKLYFMISV